MLTSVGVRCTAMKAGLNPVKAKMAIGAIGRNFSIVALRD